MTAGLTLDELTIGYRGRRPTTIASGLHAVAQVGRLTTLIGPNGAGKSTLLRTVCGLQKPLSGAVRLADCSDTTRMRPARLARRIATVGTQIIDPGRLTAREVAELGRTPYLGATGRLSADDRARADWALEAVRAQSLADRPFHDLSDGEAQRVLAARALTQEPELLVLDEPTSHLDAPSRVEFLDLLSTLARENALTVLVSSHELELAMRLSDAIWLLSPDGALTTGSPLEVAASGAVSAAFDRGRLRFDPERFVFDVQSDG
ncbi:ABC transporter ATP-binding protein [Gordonia neofelifaecis]|uniref:ABC transporter-like protein n=1 Tax=Gordonia neofelifaecis NRRL B-59395 TaxID=644548 RepID=F1YJ33_9ACTN|nr:ABC transporter ATP-binding protein [Gordonia neofelifaecis]EGD55491.1 ABC transporter-like protein [Gordonia neofelifaecis NRRL B-59395]